MNITDIKIQRYGVWRDLNLPVHPRGLTVIHGPNEAGKSTIMRFVRGIFHGFPEQSRAHGSLAQRAGWGGTLELKDGDETLEVWRRIDEQGKRQFHCHTEQHSLSESEFAARLGRVDANLFRSIYSLGLKELRELSSLQSDQVSEYIYGTSLGLVGQRLMNAEAGTRKRSRELLNPEKRTGRLFDLSGEYNSLGDALARSERVMSQYRETLTDADRWEHSRNDIEVRIENLERERRNLRYMHRVWNPWKRQQELQRELLEYDELLNFPSDGIRQLELLDRKLELLRQKRTSQRNELRQLQKRLKDNRKHYELRDHASGIRALIDLRGLVETAERHLAAVSADATMLKAELDEKLEGLGQGWTVQKLEEVDTSPQAHLQLVTAAKNYQNALSRRARHRKRYQKLSDTNHNRQTELQDELKRRGVTSLDEALEQAQQRLKDLEQLAQLRIQESEYAQRIRSAQTMLQKYREGAELPWWASSMLTLFAIAGGFLVIAGLFKGVRTGWLIGLIYMLTGIAGGALSWALRQHFETDDYHVHTKLEQEIRDCERRLNTVRDDISRITGIPYNTHSGIASEKDRKASQTELIQKATQQLFELEELARTENRILKTRKKLSVQRGKLTTYQREVSMGRQGWCDLLKKLGLKETVRTSEAFQNWQQAVTADQTLVKWTAAREDVQRQNELLAMFREQTEQIARRMDLEPSQGRSLSQMLAQWQQALDRYEQIRDTYQKQRGQYRDLKKQYELTRKDLEFAEHELVELLERGHAKTPEQFRRNAGKLQRGRELRALLADINDQLTSLSREEPELAIVEEDLKTFNGQQAQERIDLIGMELEDLERDREECSEELGRARQRLTALESETAAADLQTRRERLLDQARMTASDWLATEAAGRTFSDMTATFEERFQPETLARASHYLNELTLGRYEQVRTPFGSRELIVHERSGATRQVSELSDGTREQLFLAIRLALVDMLAEEQTVLPMVLDDICVNFDQQRTEAAVSTILDFAERRQVLFFTCHEHLAQMFQHRGIEPVWLPKHAEGELQRLAG